MGYSFPLQHQTIGAAGAVANALAGTAIEYMGDDVMLDIYGDADIVGMTFSLTAFRGAEPGEQLIPTGSGLALASTPGLVKSNENFLASVSIRGGSRLVMPVSNPGAASFFNFLFVVH